MRLDDYDPNSDIQDMGTGGGGFSGGFGGGGLGSLIGFLPLLLGRRMGCGTILLIAVVGYFLLNSGMFSASMPSGGPATTQGQTQGGGGNVACDTQSERFACAVFSSTDKLWSDLFAAQGKQYPRPSLRFYSRAGTSGCGSAQSAMGPFYCPADQGVYLDTEFFAELNQRFGAAGDAAAAYVVAHEVGHHIQKVTGIADQVQAAQARSSRADGNALQVRMELQADCYAGVWAARAKNKDGSAVLEPGDIEEAMRAANAIGDDTLMKQAGQRPVEAAFTHGTSQQRMEWLQRGLQTGNPSACNTFN